MIFGLAIVFGGPTEQRAMSPRLADFVEKVGSCDAWCLLI